MLESDARARCEPHAPREVRGAWSSVLETRLVESGWV
jgi:hypothetical protein